MQQFLPTTLFWPSRLHRIALVLYILLAIGWIGNTAVLADDNATPKKVNIPVFFLTDRGLKNGQFTGHRKYITKCQHHPFYGIAQSVQENTNQLSSSHISTLSWTAGSKPARNTVQKVLTNEAEEAGFFAQLRKAVAETDSKELYIFIHGYNTTFDQAAQHATALAYFSKQPTLLYSWPSAGKLFSYSHDEGNVEWSLEHFGRLIDNLQRFKVTEPRRITLIAHSMGNRLLIWSSEKIVSSKLFKQVMLVSPDFDAETFNHYLLHFSDNKQIDVKNGAPKGIIFVSFKDDALVLSQYVHGGYFRLGEGLGSLLDMVSSTANQILTPPSLITDVSESPSESASGSESASDNQGNLRFIDFTRIDTGLLGHSLPAEVLVEISKSGYPGPDYRLIAAPARRRRFVSLCIRRSLHFKEQVNGVKDQTFERIIKDSTSARWAHP
jgi:esterase/lipase superfamily enzyme